MKKIIILSILLVLGLSLVVFALGALKVDFANEGVIPTAGGFVIVNRAPDGNTEATIQIQVWNLDPETEYRVRSGSNLIGIFETNKQGKGHIHINLPIDLPPPIGADSEADLACSIGIWTAPSGMVKILYADICD